MLEVGGTSILVPQFNVKKYAELIKKEKPNYIMRGVPTLFEAVTLQSLSCSGEKLDYHGAAYSRAVFAFG